MNEKMDKKATKTEKDDGMVFQYRNKTITPEMDGPDVTMTEWYYQSSID